MKRFKLTIINHKAPTGKEVLYVVAKNEHEAVMSIKTPGVRIYCEITLESKIVHQVR